MQYFKGKWHQISWLQTVENNGFFLQPLNFCLIQHLIVFSNGFVILDGLSTDLEKIYEDMPEKDPPTWTNNKWVNQEVEDE